MVYGYGCGVVRRDSNLMNYDDMRLFYLLLATMKFTEVPFTHICE
jgi:hypothetical protein